MKTFHKDTAPRYQRDGITSYLLVSKHTSGAEKLSITLVEMEPGGFQHSHHHDPEQMYYILEGSGWMTVDGEEQKVEAGDCLFFPSQAEHGLNNSDDGVLRYLSASSPSFTNNQCEAWWPLPPVKDSRE
jgi:quercetin dioxygenase-like cupin family protein